MKLNSLIKPLAGALYLCAAAPLWAEDIDLFNVHGADTIPPNILFVLDNSANWDATLYRDANNAAVSKSKVIHNALYRMVTNANNFDKFRMGIMTFSKANSPKGGIVNARVSLLNNSYSNTLKRKIKYNGEATGQDLLPKSNNKPYALAFNEAFRYFKGNTALSGSADGTYTLSSQGNTWLSSGYDPAAFSDISNFTYRSPVTSGENCARNVIIFIGSGSPDSGEDTAAEAALSALGGVKNSDPVALTPNNFASNWSDEFARHFAGSDFADNDGTQNVITYVINVANPETETTSPDLAARALLKSIAALGKGDYFLASNQEAIDEALQNILVEVLATNSVFAASTLPVSVNVRGTNLNQVYMGVFRPNESWRQRWMGNLKLYKLALDGNNNVYLADSNNARAEDTTNGFIRDSAVSFWTHSSSFWDFNTTNYPNPSDTPDGNLVEKGGAAQRIRENVIAARAASTAYTASRNLYTCTDANCSSLKQLESADITATLGLNGTSTPTATDFVNWVYGARNKSTDLTGETTGEEGTRAVRASVHGDVLHSRPAVISYTNDENNVYAYYGANDGIFHALRGGTGSTEGHERWGFIPYELLPRLRAIYDNNVMDQVDTKPYFLDGSIGVRREVNESNVPTLIHLYVTMRRGGRAIYALNVTTQPPATPTGIPFSVVWNKSGERDAEYSKLGQTWSEPRIGAVATGADTTRKLLFFGGGYDPAFDDYRNIYASADENTITEKDPDYPDGRAIRGRNIYAVNPADGSVVWDAASHISASADGPNQFEEVYPIPSDVALVDTDKNGTIDRLYVGDTGGNLWRVTTTDTDPTQWQVMKLASFGSNQKFLYPPDVVKLEDGTGYAILISSGDREDPKNDRSTSTNRMYMVKDTAATTSTVVLSDLAPLPSDPSTPVDISGKKGWYLELATNEKGVSSAVTLNGVTFFNTNQFVSDPSDTSCQGSLGIARVYAFNYLTGKAYGDTRSTQVAGGGLQPSPVAAMVELTGADGRTHLVETVIVGPTPFVPPGPKLGRRVKSYWYKDLDAK